jgi:hypothetical protein
MQVNPVIVPVPHVHVANWYENNAPPILDNPNRAGVQNPRASFYSGGHPVKFLNVSNILGPEAASRVSTTFEYLKDGFRLKDERPHLHGYADLIRTINLHAIMYNYVPRGAILNVKGSFPQMAYSQDVNNNGYLTERPFAKRAHVIYPLVGPVDQERHREWRQKMIDATDPTLRYPLENSCRCPLTVDPVTCLAGTGCMREFRAILALDAVMELDVMPFIVRRMQLDPNIVAYITYIDFAIQLDKGVFGGQGDDEEFLWHKTSTGVNVIMKGNSSPYANRVLNTGGHSVWQFLVGTRYYLVKQLRAMQHGELKFVCAQMMDIGTEQMVGVHVSKYAGVADGGLPYYRIDQNELAVSADFVSAVIDKKVKEMLEWLRLALHKHTEVIEYDVARSEFVLTVLKERNWLGLRRQKEVIRAPRRAMEHIIHEYVGKTQPSDIVRVFRKNFTELIKPKTEDPTTTGYGMTIGQSFQTQMAAVIIGNSLMGRFLRVVSASDSTRSMERLLKKEKPVKIFDWYSFFSMLLQILVVCGIGYGALTWATNLGVDAVTPNLKEERYRATDYNPLIIVLLGIFLALLAAARSYKMKTIGFARILPSQCVLDDKRLCISTQAGHYDAKWKFIDPDWRPVGPSHFLCNAKDQPGAYQIGPLFDFDGYCCPVVKHSCRRTIMSAAIRVASNKVRPSPLMLEDFKIYVRKYMFGKIKRDLARASVDVDYTEWKARYPETYRFIMDMAKNDLDALRPSSRRYGFMPKLGELNFADFGPEDLDNPKVNTIKERGIACPADLKKVCANPFMWALEEFFKKTDSKYCQGDWNDIAQDVNRLRLIPNSKLVCTDGSGFDMTQHKEMNELFNEMCELVLNHANCNLQEPVHKYLIMHYLKESLCMKMSVGMGAVKFEAYGRASGDGWTTVANTWLSKCYYSFVMHRAGIRDNEWDGLFKGDDSLMSLTQKKIPVFNINMNECFARRNEFMSHGLGQVVKFIKIGDIEDVDFLSSHFYERFDGTLRMVRDPKRVFQTLAWTTKIPHGLDTGKHEIMAKQLLYAKASCLYAWSKGLPIFDVLARHMMKLGLKTGKYSNLMEYSDYGRRWDDDDAADDGSYASYLLVKYGITQHAIHSIEEAIKSTTSYYDLVSVPELKLFYI